jgi:hypothetical protein
MKIENDTHKSKMQKAVLAKITGEKLSMRPRVYFTLKMLALIVCAILALLVSALLANFVLFHIFESNHAPLLGFGLHGLWLFLVFFPWPLLVLDIVLIVVLERLLREFRFGYRSPVLYLLLGVLSVAIVLGLALEHGTGFNQDLDHRAHHGEFPSPLNALFLGLHRPPPEGHGVCKCVVTQIAGNVISAIDPHFDATTSITIILPTDTADATTSGLVIGDTVFVIGEEKDNVIQARGLRIVPADTDDSATHDPGSNH